MDITLNNQSKVFPDPCTVQQLLDKVLPENQKGIAIAVNETVVPKTDWLNYFIQPKDSVLIINATSGG